MEESLRVVLDTNVLLASRRSRHPESPNVEIFSRWQAGEFTFLYSHDIAIEYAEKLLEHGVAKEDIRQFLSLLRFLGEWVEIEFFHLRYYPEDSDDVAFLLTALNGDATHLVTYDEHLKKLVGLYLLAICEPLQFLKDCRSH